MKCLALVRAQQLLFGFRVVEFSLAICTFRVHPNCNSAHLAASRLQRLAFPITYMLSIRSCSSTHDHRPRKSRLLVQLISLLTHLVARVTDDVETTLIKSFVWPHRRSLEKESKNPGVTRNVSPEIRHPRHGATRFFQLAS